MCFFLYDSLNPLNFFAKMYPEDRVLVAYIPDPVDFDIVRNEGWYRIPQKFAPKGLYAEYIAFYFGRKFGDEKWAIHYYAERLGHELVSRRELFPDEPDHPRADALYYKVQLGRLRQLSRPIVSLRWRRVTFLHTTWDRFQDAVELNDLFIDGGEYVDRVYAVLKDRGIRAERNYHVEEEKAQYVVPLAILCTNGRIEITHDQIPTKEPDFARFLDEIMRETAVKGGVIAKLGTNGYSC